MSAEIFIDTNVFIYHLDGTDPRKQSIAERIVRQALLEGNACISFQVVQECLNTVLRKARIALDVVQARAYLDAVLAPLMQVSASAPLYHRALDVQARWHFSFYDSLVVGAALSVGCTRLFSEDLQHGQRIDTLTIHDPFRASGH
ncbi:MAG: PIN domain-containing protein [Burkholderiales bacterium]|nr:PIN domain-containing protein [Burkholderiales bacterium]OJX06166.1 MAG: VapC toxin family PIN domain ribonuclease [Burkholderiales bacterium 70-64]